MTSSTLNLVNYGTEAMQDFLASTTIQWVMDGFQEIWIPCLGLSVGSR